MPGQDDADDPFSFDIPDSFDPEEDEPDGIDLIGDYSDADAGLDGDIGRYDEETTEEARRVEWGIVSKVRLAQERLRIGSNHDFFFCVVFTSMEQRDAFLSKTGWDKHGVRYINGVSLAKALGVDLPKSGYEPTIKDEADPDWAKLATMF